MQVFNRQSQEAIALEETAAAVPRMIARGVTRKHIPCSALVMWGLGLMEQAVHRKSIGLWLGELSEKYLDAQRITDGSACT